MAFTGNPYTMNPRGGRPTAVTGLNAAADPMQEILQGRRGAPPSARPSGIPGRGPRTGSGLPNARRVVRRGAAPKGVPGRQRRAAASAPRSAKGRAPVRLDYNKIGNIPPIPGTGAAAQTQARQAQQMGGPPGVPPGGPPGVPPGVPSGGPPPAAGPTLMAGGVPGVGQPGAVTGGPPGAGMNTGQVAGTGMKPNVRRRTA